MDFIGSLATGRLTFFRGGAAGDAFAEWTWLVGIWVRPHGSRLDKVRHEAVTDLETYLVKDVLECDPNDWIAHKRRWPFDRFDPTADKLYRTYDDPFVVFTVAPAGVGFVRKAHVHLLHFSPKANETADLWARVIEPRYRRKCPKGPWP